MIKLILPLLLVTSVAVAHQSDTYHTSKHSSMSSKKALVKLPTDRLFYSTCNYYVDERSKPLSVYNDCGYKVRKNKKRAGRIELEHVVPASVIGANMACWRKGGRKLCNRDKHFKAAAYDLYNLVLAIGELNGDRSNRKFGDLSSEPNMYGDVDFKVSYSKDLVEPRDEIKGDVARIYYYMRWKYNTPMSQREEKLFGEWHYKDPVSEDELKRNEAIYKIQRTVNPFVQR